MKNKIIGIGGLKNSGKDTCSKMLQYCLCFPNWLHKYKYYKLFNKFCKQWEITSFASILKKSLAILINKSEILLNDRNFKEHWYIRLHDLKITDNISKINILNDKKFNKLLKDKDFEIINNSFITIRQLLQMYGTNIIRSTFGNNFWINRTLNSNNNLIVSDVRFINELEEIKNRSGIVIYINRDSCIPGDHPSEQEIYELYKLNKFDYIINNNKDIKCLFKEISNISKFVKDK